VRLRTTAFTLNLAIRGVGAATTEAKSAMATVVNLNRVRKQRQRAEAERRAAENRIAFGRTKDERQKAARERQRLETDLEGKRLD
jgi:hypothetical protein